MTYDFSNFEMHLIYIVFHCDYIYIYIYIYISSSYVFMIVSMMRILSTTVCNISSEQKRKGQHVWHVCLCTKTSVGHYVLLSQYSKIYRNTLDIEINHRQEGCHTSTICLIGQKYSEYAPRVRTGIRRARKENASISDRSCRFPLFNFIVL